MDSKFYSILSFLAYCNPVCRLGETQQYKPQRNTCPDNFGKDRLFLFYFLYTYSNIFDIICVLLSLFEGLRRYCLRIKRGLQFLLL